MLQSIGMAVLRSVVAYALLLVVIRCLGRKAVSEMTVFDLGVALALGSITANVGFGSEHSFQNSVTVLITFGILGVVSESLHLRFFAFGKMLNSEPLVLIDNGELVKENMKKSRLTLTELMSLLREKNTFHIADVQYAVFETDGKLSVLPRADKIPVTPADMRMHPAGSGLTRELIIDGKVMEENLNQADLTKDWLMKELKKQGIRRAEDVFFAALDASGGLYVSTGGKKGEVPGRHGLE